MPRTITITVPHDHTKGVKVETDGFVGPSCAKMTDKFVRAYGGEVTSSEHKEEFYQVEPQTEKNVEFQ